MTTALPGLIMIGSSCTLQIKIDRTWTDLDPGFNVQGLDLLSHALWDKFRLRMRIGLLVKSSPPHTLRTIAHLGWSRQLEGGFNNGCAQLSILH